IIALKRFEDVVAVAGYPVDIHHASGGDCTMIYCDDSYDIPYRVLVPEKIGGLLVAGRSSSMNHEAMAATRVMSTCMALGQAAGTAARLAIDAGVPVADVDVKALQEELLKNDAFLG
ncbi:MAG: FAD-dependent oxidoreductase, partial [Bacteroidales bacterium]|nr:FAD-dependent oxidoreductase [Bacteroidales bacterium]